MKRMTMMVLLASLAMLAGCGGGKTDSAPGETTANPGAGKTPIETVQNALLAIQANDGKSYADCFKANAEGKRTLAAACHVSHLMIEFNRKLCEAYGEDVALIFEAAGRDYDQMRAENAKKIIKIDGNRAAASAPGEEPVTMLREKDLWLLRVEEMEQVDRKQADEMLEISRGMIEALTEAIEEIGKPGQAPERISSALQAKMMAVVMKPTPAEQREGQREAGGSLADQVANTIEQARRVTEDVVRDSVKSYIVEHKKMPALADLIAADLLYVDPAMWNIIITGTKEKPTVTVKHKVETQYSAKRNGLGDRATAADENQRLTLERITKIAIQIYIARNDALPKSVADLGDMVEYDDTKWDIMISGTKNDPKVTVKAKK